MTMQDKSIKPKSRWLQFSITTILVITTFSAVLVGWWRDRTHLRQQLEIERKRVEKARFETDRAKRDVQVAKQRARVGKYTADKIRVEMQAKLDEAIEALRESQLPQSSQATYEP